MFISCALKRDRPIIIIGDCVSRLYSLAGCCRFYLETALVVVVVVVAAAAVAGIQVFGASIYDGSRRES